MQQRLAHLQFAELQRNLNSEVKLEKIGKINQKIQDSLPARRNLFGVITKFCNTLSHKTSLATLCKLRTPPIRQFTLIKNSLLGIPFV